MWVIFEGLDKSGKTTLEWEFLKWTKFKHQVVDRGPAGYMAFDKIFNRSTVEGDIEFMRQAMKMNNDPDVLVVYCHCSPEVAYKRLKEFGEDCPYDYEESDKLLFHYINMMYDEDKLILVDTTKESVQESTKRIVKKLESMMVDNLKTRIKRIEEDLIIL